MTESLPADTLLTLEIMLLLLTVGGVSGFLSGLLGVGGGALFVPALYFSLSAIGFDSQYAMHMTIGSSLAIVFLTGTTSAVQHYRRGSVDVDLLRRWGRFIVLGVVAGAFLAAFARDIDLKKIFAFVTLLIALYMAFGRERAESDRPRHMTERLQNGICAGIGAISSMIGVGGAVLTIPLMTYIGVPMQRAVGTGAGLGVLISLPGALAYMVTGTIFEWGNLPAFSLGYVNFLAVGAVAPAAMLMSPLGVAASHNMPKSMLRRVFAVVLTIVSIRMFMTL